jgi:hypothetical protein
LDKAKALLAEAVRVVDAQLPNAQAMDLGTNWSRWICTRSLRREAEAIIERHPATQSR